MRRRQFLQLASLAAANAAARSAFAASPARSRVVVVGGGFAGATCALYLKRLDAAIDVCLVDPDDRYVTCPMSNEVLVGLRDPRSITISRKGLARAGVRCIRDRVNAIDADRRNVRLDGGGRLAFDRLVVAPGIRFLWGMPEGYDEAAAQRMPHAWKAGAQTRRLAAQLRAMDAGGVVAISVPRAPIRCPPGPYERASLIARFLKRHKPRSKVLILDANNRMPQQDLFTDAWQTLYPGLIEWMPMTQDGAIVRVDPASMTLYTEHAAHRVAVANIIPPQAPGELALDAGLASGHGWCPIDPRTFESQLVSQVHVIGDACIADAMPKSASAANSQAKQCALAIVALLAGREPPEPSLHNTCYNLIAPDYAFSISGIYRVADAQIRPVEGSGGGSPVDASLAFRAREAQYAQSWYTSIVADSFAV